MALNLQSGIRGRASATYTPGNVNMGNAAAAAFSPGKTQPAQSTAQALSPTTPVGAGVLIGAGSLALLFLIRYSLPA
jgi:hypothetical protein